VVGAVLAAGGELAAAPDSGEEGAGKIMESNQMVTTVQTIQGHEVSQ
jgi:hypothetical protein